VFDTCLTEYVTNAKCMTHGSLKRYFCDISGVYAISGEKLYLCDLAGFISRF